MAKKILGQVLPSRMTDTTLYTVPAGYSTSISLLKITSSIGEGESNRYDVFVVPSGATKGDIHRFHWAKMKGISERVEFDGVMLSGGDSIVVRSDNDYFSFHLYGDELQNDFDDLIAILNAINTTRQTKPTCVP